MRLSFEPTYSFSSSRRTLTIKSSRIESAFTGMQGANRELVGKVND